jgi:hypothetical protein
MRHNCLVKSCTAANSNIYCIELEPENPSQVSFAAGQYLQILLPEGEASAFSIASSPRETDRLELNILQVPILTVAQRPIYLCRATSGGLLPTGRPQVTPNCPHYLSGCRDWLCANEKYVARNIFPPTA